MWIKTREGYLGSEETQPHTGSPGLEFIARKMSPHELWL